MLVLSEMFWFSYKCCNLRNVREGVLTKIVIKTNDFFLYFCHNFLLKNNNKLAVPSLSLVNIKQRKIKLQVYTYSKDAETGLCDRHQQVQVIIFILTRVSAAFGRQNPSWIVGW